MRIQPWQSFIEHLMEQFLLLRLTFMAPLRLDSKTDCAVSQLNMEPVENRGVELSLHVPLKSYLRSSRRLMYFILHRYWCRSLSILCTRFTTAVNSGCWAHRRAEQSLHCDLLQTSVGYILRHCFTYSFGVEPVVISVTNTDSGTTTCDVCIK